MVTGLAIDSTARPRYRNFLIDTFLEKKMRFYLNCFKVALVFLLVSSAFAQTKLLSWECAEEITGVIQNTSKKNLSYVSVIIPLYKDDIKVGDAMANVAGIDAGGKWAFKAFHMVKDMNKCGAPKITAM